MSGFCPDRWYQDFLKQCSEHSQLCCAEAGKVLWFKLGEVMKNIMEALTKLQNPSICRDGRICQRETHSYCSINHELMAQWPNRSSSWVKGIDCSKLIKQPHTELAEYFHRMLLDHVYSCTTCIWIHYLGNGILSACFCIGSLLYLE